MKIQLAVVSLWAEDVPANANFYREVVGLKLIPQHAGGRPHFDLGGCYLTIVRGRPAPIHPPADKCPGGFLDLSG
jgi:catechol 2,3-dioxygenase-like lactoylglutathione lyase family enzyme